MDRTDERTPTSDDQSTNSEVEGLKALLREALPFVETYETGEILSEGMSRATYDNLVLRIRMAVWP